MSFITYTPRNITMVIKSEMMRCLTLHAYRKQEMNYKFWKETWREGTTCRPNSEYEDNIKVDISEVEFGVW